MGKHHGTYLPEDPTPKDVYNFRVGVCGWSKACFDERTYAQLYDPKTLAAAAHEEEINGRTPCPSGVCIADRNRMYTGAYAESDLGDGNRRERLNEEWYQSQQLDREWDANHRTGQTVTPQQAPVKQLEEGSGEWVPFDRGAEIRQEAPAHRSLWDVLTGK